MNHLLSILFLLIVFNWSLCSPQEEGSAPRATRAILPSGEGNSLKHQETVGGGLPGQDFPTLSVVPRSSKFQCRGILPGYYADEEYGCQVFHICHADSRRDSFLCPNGTIFHQLRLVCDWWYNVDCASSSLHQNVNAEFGKTKTSSRRQGRKQIHKKVASKKTTSNNLKTDVLLKPTSSPINQFKSTTKSQNKLLSNRPRTNNVNTRPHLKEIRISKRPLGPATVHSVPKKTILPPTTQSTHKPRPSFNQVKPQRKLSIGQPAFAAKEPSQTLRAPPLHKKVSLPKRKFNNRLRKPITAQPVTQLRPANQVTFKPTTTQRPFVSTSQLNPPVTTLHPPFSTLSHVETSTGVALPKTTGLNLKNNLNQGRGRVNTFGNTFGRKIRLNNQVNSNRNQQFPQRITPRTTITDIPITTRRFTPTTIRPVTILPSVKLPGGTGVNNQFFNLGRPLPINNAVQRNPKRFNNVNRHFVSQQQAVQRQPQRPIQRTTSRVTLPRTTPRITPQRTTPARVTPQRTTPARVTPQRTTPTRVTHQRTTPARITSQRVTPQRTIPQRITPPRPVTQRVTSPRVTSQRTTPRTSTRVTSNRQNRRLNHDRNTFRSSPQVSTANPFGFSRPLPQSQAPRNNVRPSFNRVNQPASFNRFNDFDDFDDAFDDDRFDPFDDDRFDDDRFDNDRFDDDRFDDDRFDDDRFDDDRFDDDRFDDDRFDDDRFDDDRFDDDRFDDDRFDDDRFDDDRFNNNRFSNNRFGNNRLRNNRFDDDRFDDDRFDNDRFDDDRFDDFNDPFDDDRFENRFDGDDYDDRFDRFDDDRFDPFDDDRFDRFDNDDDFNFGRRTRGSPANDLSKASSLEPELVIEPPSEIQLPPPPP